MTKVVIFDCRWSALFSLWVSRTRPQRTQKEANKKQNAKPILNSDCYCKLIETIKPVHLKESDSEFAVDAVKKTNDGFGKSDACCSLLEWIDSKKMNSWYLVQLASLEEVERINLVQDDSWALESFYLQSLSFIHPTPPIISHKSFLFLS